MRMAGATLELDAAVAGAVVGCRQAVVDEAARGIAITQAPPFARTDPDPCDLAQLPGKIPPVTQADVR